MSLEWWLDRYKNLREKGTVGSMAYGDEKSVHYKVKQSSVRPHLRMPETGRMRHVLDFGCGRAQHLKFLEDVYGADYLGADIVDFVIEDNRRDFPGKEFVYFQNRDEIQGMFDIVWAASVIQHMDDRELDNCLAWIYSRMMVNGVFAFIVCTDTSRSHNSYMYFRSEEFYLDALEVAGFHSVSVLNLPDHEELIQCYR